MQEVAVGIGVSQGYAACRQDVGAMLFQLSQEHRGTEHEHTAVPQVSTRGQVFGSHFRRRLLLERLDREATLSNGFTTVDVAKTGFSVSRGDTERHQTTRLSVHLSNRYSLSESVFIMNMMVGSQYQQDRVSSISRCFKRSQSDGRRSVAGERLKDDTTATHLRYTQLLGDDKAVIFVAHNNRRRVLKAFQAAQGALKHGSLILAIKGKKLLRETLSR